MLPAMAETDKSHVHCGRDGWLFLIGGSNRVHGPLSWPVGTMVGSCGAGRA